MLSMLIPALQFFLDLYVTRTELYMLFYLDHTSLSIL